MPDAHYSSTSEVAHVAMRDGVRLSAHIHRPDAPGRFPALVQYTPYRNRQFRRLER